MAAITTYNVYSDACKVVPFIALVTANHVRLVGCPADAVELDRLVRVCRLQFDRKGLRVSHYSIGLQIMNLIAIGHRMLLVTHQLASYR